MLMHGLYETFGLPGVFLALLLLGLSLYSLLAGPSYLLFFVWKRGRYHPHYRPHAEELLASVRWALCSIAGNAVLMLPLEFLILSGRSRMYFSVADYGWLYLCSSAVAVLVITETLIYWIHRGLHTGFLYRYVHVYHHRFKEPTPLASLAFHPLDSFAQGVPYHLCAFLFPLHVGLYHGFVIAVTVWTIMIHDRIRWTTLSCANHTGCHTVHHWYGWYNFGQYFNFWDRLCGTYRSPADLPEQFAASWPAERTRWAAEVVPHASQAER